MQYLYVSLVRVGFDLSKPATGPSDDKCTVAHTKTAVKIKMRLTFGFLSGNNQIMTSALKQHRMKNGVTLAKIAEHFGVMRSTVLRWETRRIPAERVLALEELTGVSRHDLRPDIYPWEMAE